jgi:two-component system, LuxR family, response regulator FixJ
MFRSGSDFLVAEPSSEDGCLIIDVRMPGIGGLEVQERVRAEGTALPVIVIMDMAMSRWLCVR